MKPIVVNIEINRPAPEVFDYLEDVENNPKWLRGMISAQWTTEPPVRVGSRYEQLAKFMGKQIRTSFEVVAHEPPKKITISSREGSSFPITVTRAVEPLDARGCRVTETVDSEPGGFYRIAQPILRVLVRRTIGRDYKRLKALLESR
jgi:uncharacterized membrane protein